ncbi:putative Polyprotein [Cucumis melo var. makuwa]|uniref:Polyprotein n=1 Tax=Cucumis melo var. makuwa TaxID=1194695 RepID=A0A5A7U3E3_CUCMM|nr:putative Polyprotein [Cucumis melo var. makuwa]TYK08081.1 putative Polyprotein [Cucumis melo var. makuwa]
MLFFLTLKNVATACTIEKQKYHDYCKRSVGCTTKKYDTEEARSKKYVVSRYLRYQMTDDKFVEAKSHEIQKIAHEIISEARNCRKKSHPAAQANLIEDELVAMISEVNVIRGSEDWWLDTGASRHVCHDLSFSRKYNEVKDKNIVLEDHHTTKVAGIGEVELKFTSDKTLVLKEVLHTAEIQKNLVFGYLLNKTLSC